MTDDEQPCEQPEPAPPLGSFMTLTAEAEVIPGPRADEQNEEATQ
jgi:hypothetical protein